MSVKIFHTADVHLGLKFGSYPEEIAKKLAEARFETLARMVELATTERCDLFVVGGDLFDNLRVAQRDIIRAAKILGAFSGVSVILPGNHDYVTGQDDDIWNVFQSTHEDRVKVLTRREVCSLQPFDLDISLYPAPCHNKHSKEHALGWIASAPSDSSRYRIGLAHGSFEGLTPDTEGEYYPMKRDDLMRLGLDLWLMGHIHVQFPVRPGASDRIFYPATPEPDGFDCRHEGKAWILEVDEEKRISARSVSTGKYRFHHETAKIRSLSEFEQLFQRYESPDFLRMLLKLNLSGAIPKDDHAEIVGKIERLKERFLFLKPDLTSLSIRLTSEDIDKEFTPDSFPFRLLTELSRRDSDSEALQTAYELIKEVRADGSLRP